METNWNIGDLVTCINKENLNETGVIRYIGPVYLYIFYYKYR